MLILATIFMPVLAGIVISVLHMEDKARHPYYAAAVIATDILGLLAVWRGKDLRMFSFAEGVDLYFKIDSIGVFFMIMVMLLYTCVVFYAFEYMRMEERENVFFAFFMVSYGALLSVCMAGNLVTMYLCFEMATLTSMPLVLHEMTKDAVNAAMKYLFYSIGGALLGLFAVFFVSYCSEGAYFAFGGILDTAAASAERKMLLIAIFSGIVGFGTKAGMYPMHGWLPAAHPIAPAPASALLSGIIAKAGVIAIIRLVYFSVGPDFIRGTWVQYAWMTLCMLTIFMGSMMAFKEKITKKRLAYSTISQISYINLGLSLLSVEGLRGGLLHVAAHAASKGCLFLCAGVFIYKLGKRRVTELSGIGRLMPITMWCFLIASLSLIGIPPMGGFTSKWHIALAAIGDGMGVYAVLPPVILLISALLTAGYLLPVVVDAFFPGHDEGKEHAGHAAGQAAGGTRRAGHGEGKAGHAAGEEWADLPPCSKEPTALMWGPMIVLCLAALLAGVFGTTLVTMII